MPGVSTPQSVVLEIDREILKNLLHSHGLSISDFRCFDSESKQCIREIYLQLIQSDLNVFSVP